MNPNKELDTIISILSNNYFVQKQKASLSFIVLINDTSNNLIIKTTIVETIAEIFNLKLISAIDVKDKDKVLHTNAYYQLKEK